MEIGKKFNSLTVKEYFHYIENHKKYVDFNSLGLYRSILENERLAISDKILVRDFANKFFQKTFDFLQIKDPFNYFELITLGKDLTEGDKEHIWEQIVFNQEKILKDKKIKHRNFGIYSKHSCGSEFCYYNELMIEQNSFLTEHEMHFDTDKNKYCAELKSKRFKKERKKEKQTIRIMLENEA